MKELAGVLYLSLCPGAKQQPQQQPLEQLDFKNKTGERGKKVLSQNLTVNLIQEMESKADRSTLAENLPTQDYHRILLKLQKV